MSAKNKNIWILLIFILSGLVIGGLIGDIASKFNGFDWLAYGQTFGLSNPINLDFSIINITFGLVLKINIASIIGIALAILIYKLI